MFDLDVFVYNIETTMYFGNNYFCQYITTEWLVYNYCTVVTDLYFNMFELIASKYYGLSLQWCMRAETSF